MARAPTFFPRWTFAVPAVMPLIGFATAAVAQLSETAVKAAFLPKFARYVEWPPAARLAPGTAFGVCTLGGDPFGRLLDEAAAGQRVGANPIAVRRIATVQQAGGCHVLFVQGSGAGRALAALRNQPILTVTDSRNSAARGMVHFAVAGGRVSFHVDDEMAAGSRLTISSRLLAVALSVRQRRS
jgi:hypothetical protein